MTVPEELPVKDSEDVHDVDTAVMTKTGDEQRETAIDNSKKSVKALMMPGDDEEQVALLDDDENNANFQSVVEEWSGGTSVHGVSLAFDTSDYRLWYRLVWVVLVVGSSSLMLWQVSTLIVQFRKHEVVTDTQVISPQKPLEFPEVTICSSNSDGQNYKKNETGIDHPATPEEVAMISQGVESFILYSAFNGKKHEFVNQTWNPILTDFGQCWQFQTNETIVRPGYSGGLTVYLWLEQYFFNKETTLAHAKVFLLTPGTNINAQLTFSSGSPGQSVDLRFQKRVFHRERKAPWSRCYSEAPQYTQGQCRRNCVYQKARDECKCRGWGDHLEPQDMRLCFSEYDQDKECLDGFDDNVTELFEDCAFESAEGSDKCTLPPCVETEYMADAINGALSVNLLNSLQNDYDVPEAIFLQNFISFHINYDRMRYEILTESKGMTENQLLANIGGSMGLFLGISFLSIWEIFGDLIGMRLIPRFWGQRHIRGLGGI